MRRLLKLTTPPGRSTNGDDVAIAFVFSAVCLKMNMELASHFVLPTRNA